MERDYWIGRWQRGETGWHQSEVEPVLVAHLSSLKPTRVLVPLCGKSLDLQWLADQGHEVLGIELSELAIQEFFSEQKLRLVESRSEGPFFVRHSERVGGGGRVTLLQGDFFSLSPEIIRSWGGSLGAIYDRAALIALPAQMRERYSRHIRSLVAACAGPEWVQLQVTLERTPTDDRGPPFSVPESEVRRLYEPSFSVDLLSREHLEECVYRFKMR